MAKRKKKKQIGTFIGGTKAQRKFKTESDYLDYIFKQNQKKIVESYRESNPNITIAKARIAFKAKVKTIRLVEKVGTRKAIELTSQMRTFTSAEEMGLLNIKKHLDADTSREIRKKQALANGTVYRNTSINWNEYTWDESLKGYIHVSRTFMFGWTTTGDSTGTDWLFVKEI